MTHFIKICTKICIVTGLTLFLATSLQAASYKWTDEKGNVHYSQRPPPGKQYEKIKIHKPPQPSDTKPAPSYSSPSSSSGDTGSKAVEDEVAKNASIIKQNCEAAKKNLNVYQVYSRVKDKDGKIRVVSPKEREEKIQAAKDAIREFCK